LNFAGDRRESLGLARRGAARLRGVEDCFRGFLLFGIVDAAFLTELLERTTVTGRVAFRGYPMTISWSCTTINVIGLIRRNAAAPHTPMDLELHGPVCPARRDDHARREDKGSRHCRLREDTARLARPRLCKHPTGPEPRGAGIG